MNTIHAWQRRREVYSLDLARTSRCSSLCQDLICVAAQGAWRARRFTSQLMTNKTDLLLRPVPDSRDPSWLTLSLPSKNASTSEQLWIFSCCLETWKTKQTKTRRRSLSYSSKTVNHGGRSPHNSTSSALIMSKSKPERAKLWLSSSRNPRYSCQSLLAW